MNERPTPKIIVTGGGNMFGFKITITTAKEVFVWLNVNPYFTRNEAMDAAEDWWNNKKSTVRTTSYNKQRKH